MAGIILYQKNLKNKIRYLTNFNNKGFYFVHSFHALPKNKNEILAYYNYGNQKITAIIGKDNVLGTQFHPEKKRIEWNKAYKSFFKSKLNI